MTRYLVAIHHPDDYDRSVAEDEAMSRYKAKYRYWTASAPLDGTLEDWLQRATEHKGSWWPYWNEWLSKYSGGWTGRRIPGAKLGTIEDAPGSYVRR